MFSLSCKRRQQQFEVWMKNCFILLNYMEDCMYSIVFIRYIGQESLIFQYFLNCLRVFIVKKQYIRTRTIWFPNLSKFYQSSIYTYFTFCSNLVYSLAFEPELFKFVVNNPSWKRAWLNNIVSDILPIFFNHKGNNFQLIIFESCTVNIIIQKSIIMVFQSNFRVDMLIQIIEDLFEVFSFTQLMNSCDVVYPFSQPTIPTAIRNRSYFKAHLIPELLDVVENFLISIKFGFTALSSIKQSQYESCKASDSSSIAFSKKIMSA